MHACFSTRIAQFVMQSVMVVLDFAAPLRYDHKRLHESTLAMPAESDQIKLPAISSTMTKFMLPTKRIHLEQRLPPETLCQRSIPANTHSADVVRSVTDIKNFISPTYSSLDLTSTMSDLKHVSQALMRAMRDVMNTRLRASGDSRDIPSVDNNVLNVAARGTKGSTKQAAALKCLVLCSSSAK